MKSKTGTVYAIQCLKTLRVYIGSSREIGRRFKTHIRNLRKGVHHNTNLQEDYDRFGETSFTLIKLETCEESELRNREQHYLDVMPHKYNIALDSIAPMANRKHSSHTLAKFKERPVRRGVESHKYGVIWTDDVRAKILKKKIGSKRNDTTKAKMRETALKIKSWNRLKDYVNSKRRPIVDSNGNTFESLGAAASFWKISVQAVCDNLKGRSKKTRPGITFAYKEPSE